MRAQPSASRIAATRSSTSASATCSATPPTATSSVAKRVERVLAVAQLRGRARALLEGRQRGRLPAAAAEALDEADGQAVGHARKYAPRRYAAAAAAKRGEKRGATSVANRSAQRHWTARGVPGMTVCRMMWSKPASTNACTRSATVSGEPMSCASVHGGICSGSYSAFQPSNVASHAS